MYACFDASPGAALMILEHRKRAITVTVGKLVLVAWKQTIKQNKDKNKFNLVANVSTI